MKLSESEMQEFIALAQNTYDPELFMEEDLPVLREAKRQWEEEQARASAAFPAEQPALGAGEPRKLT
jgi:hypothetical protein